MSVLEVANAPQWWVDRALLALAAEGQVQKEREREMDARAHAAH